ncbi:Ig-like domain-containing protein [Haloarchaeobius amylolyticus]|uniref:Ig-like domain-containing protein n=1 Tax=Haloarchaeobius amylolyticus TaxID=1198296 RepID=UPI0022716F93|nr:Ig-like domain-containing protein [Haloarchaeobius amylolyticus]
MQHTNKTFRIGGDERGVSPVLGGILIFGLVLALLALTQVSLVPAMNGNVEFEHNQGVQDDFEALHSSTYRVASTGAPESTSIQLGTRYPARMFLVNPAPASGSLTSDQLGVTIENVSALDADTREYLQSLGDTLDVNTSSLVYQPRYNQYTTAPATAYEYGVVYNRFGNAATTLVADEGFIDGNRITLVAVAADISEQQVGSKQLTVHPVSAPAQGIAVTNTTGDTLTLRVKTTLPEARWDEILADQQVANGGKVVAYTYTTGTNYNTLVVTLASGQVYDLRLAGIGIEETVATPSLDATYLVKQSGGDRYLTVGASEPLTVQVRDAYNNPVSGVVVNASVSGKGSLVTTAEQTDEDGEATFQYDPGMDNGSATVTVWFGSNAADPVKSTTYGITVGDKPEVDLGDTINPDSSEGSFRLETASRVGGAGGETVEMEFTNNGTERTISEVRINMYIQGKPGNNNPRPISAELTDATGSTTYATVAVGGKYVEIPTADRPTFGDGATATLRVNFYTDAGATTAYSASNSDDFFVVSLTFDDGETAVYFVPSYV